jgi:hypothetical protein
VAPAFACRQQLPREERVKRIARVQLRLSYRCCGIEWMDEYPLVLPMPCPDCGVLIAAYEVIELIPGGTQKTKRSARKRRD